MKIIIMDCTVVLHNIETRKYLLENGTIKHIGNKCTYLLFNE